MHNSEIKLMLSLKLSSRDCGCVYKEEFKNNPLVYIHSFS